LRNTQAIPNSNSDWLVKKYKIENKALLYGTGGVIRKGEARQSTGKETRDGIMTLGTVQVFEYKFTEKHVFLVHFVTST
jgi:hypothetical protein